jgi:predicted N-acetyltransferase YhbS
MAGMNETAFGLRPIEITDAAEVAALIRRAFASITPPLVPSPSALKETTETVAATISKGGGAVAEAAGGIVGSALWDERDGGLYIGRISVSPDFRRRGVARALVLAGEAEARLREMPRVHLATRLALVSNRQLFASLGFRETTLHAHDGYDHPTWVDMEKPLG